MSAMGQVPVPQAIHALESRDQQHGINEHEFSRLNEVYTDACRDVDALESALSAARTRQRVLGAAMEVLNEPKTVDSPPPVHG